VLFAFMLGAARIWFALARADHAMRQAKAAGRDRVVMAS
jgi:PleD family two-component response regulator